MPISVEIVALILTGVMGVIGYLIKQQIRNIEVKLESLNNRLDKIEDDRIDLSRQLSDKISRAEIDKLTLLIESKVAKDDFIREINNFKDNFTRVNDNIDGLKEILLNFKLSKA